MHDVDADVAELLKRHGYILVLEAMQRHAEKERRTDDYGITTVVALQAAIDTYRLFT